MKNRREFLSLGLASFAAMAMLKQQKTPVGVGINTLSVWDLPPINLNGWEAAIRELTFPPGLESPKHTHTGFVLGYVLEGKFRFQVEGRPEVVLSAGETFYEPPGAIHLLSGSASPTQSTRVLVVTLGEKGKEFTKRL